MPDAKPNPWRSKESPLLTVEVLESSEVETTYRLLTNSLGRPVAGEIHEGTNLLKMSDGTVVPQPFTHAMDAPRHTSTALFLETYEVVRDA